MWLSNWNFLWMVATRDRTKPKFVQILDQSLYKYRDQSLVQSLFGENCSKTKYDQIPNMDQTLVPNFVWSWVHICFCFWSFRQRLKIVWILNETSNFCIKIQPKTNFLINFLYKKWSIFQNFSQRRLSAPLGPKNHLFFY